MGKPKSRLDRARQQRETYAKVMKLSETMPCRDETNEAHPALAECLRCNAALGEACKGKR